MYNIVVTFLASVLIWFMFLGLLILWVVDGRIKKEQVLHAVLSVIIAWVLTVILKDIFNTGRPYLDGAGQALTLTTPNDPSFPSTHTAVAFALAMTIYLHDRKNGLVFFWGAFLVAVGRILANVHFPFDTLIGAFFGVFVAWILGKSHLFGILKRK